MIFLWLIVIEVFVALACYGSVRYFILHQGYGRAYFSATSAHTCTGDGNAMAARAGIGLEVFYSIEFGGFK